ncbi:MAG: hypothetical protein JWM59_1774 [Verrucomicrobiales bacterium]|nr:hypothetical protein [Verrucomicrobiales bacterium]
MAVLSSINGGLKAEPSTPSPDFLRVDTGPPLPAKAEGGVDAEVREIHGASTGDKGWLVSWAERGPDERYARLVVRLLPPNLEQPPGGRGNAASGFAYDSVIITNQSPSSSSQTLNGNGGGWMAWQESEAIWAQWFDQAARGPKGAPLKLHQGASNTSAVVASAGDGHYAWLIWMSFENQSLLYLGAVMENTPEGPVIKSRFILPQNFDPTKKPVAVEGHCLFSLIGNDINHGVETFVLNSAGALSGHYQLEFPEGVWRGVMPMGDGFLGLWQVNYLQPVMYGREMTRTGDWKEGSVAAVITTLSLQRQGDYEFTPGPGGLVISVGESGAVLVRSDKSISTLAALDERVRNFYATANGQVLQLCSNPASDQLRARQVPDGASSLRPAILTEGSGRQTAPSLAWTSSGPQVVFQVESYGYEQGGW